MVRRAVALGASLVVLLWTTAFAHAVLLSSEPAAGSRLADRPSRVRLVFSEPLEPALGRIELIASDGGVRRLASAGDPRDVHAVIAPVDGLAPGSYRVKWRVVSADGHPVEGSFTFAFSEGVTRATVTPTRMPADSMETVEDTGALPVVAAVLRGLALSSLMALGGVLFFASFTAGERVAPNWRVPRTLSIAAATFLAAHLAAWTVHASADHSLTRDSLAAVAPTMSGKIEIWRLALVVLALWAVTLTHRMRLALFFTVAALLLSGASGHSAAIHPEWGIPAKALHLVAGAAWLGGLLWLLLIARRDALGSTTAVSRVSGIALAAAIAVAFAGIVQLRLFLPSWADLFHSAYGAIGLAKVAGLIVLVGFGAYHRFRVLPSLTVSPGVGLRFATTIRGELGVMLLVIILGAFLAYTPPPSPPEAHEHSTSPVP